MKFARVAFGLGALVCATEAKKMPSVIVVDEDMDHGLDFDFSEEGSGDLIPLTPKESGKNTEPTFDVEREPTSNSVDLYGGDSNDLASPDDQWWTYYLEYALQYKHELYEYLLVVADNVTKHFLYAEHYSIEDRYDAFKFGLIDGLFKLQPRAQGNCFTEGLELYWTFRSLAYQMMYEEHFDYSMQESFNFDDVMINFFHKCSMQDTLPGTIFLNLGMYAIDEMPPSVRAYFMKVRLLMHIADISGAGNFMAEMGYYTNVSLYKKDPFTKGRVVGKLIKTAV